MELLSLHCPPSVNRLPSSSSWRRAAMEKPTSFVGQAISFPSKSNRRPDARNPGSLDFRPRASGSTQVATGSSPKTGEAIKQEMSSKDDDLAFVAGATGRVGSRTVRELLRLGFRVRAGVRSAQKAETLVQSVQRMKLDDVTGSLETQPVEKLEIVECDLENQSSILPAIGKASIVICCIGASEKEVFDVTGPYRIDYKATKNLIEEATFAKVDHFILLTSLGTNKIGFPASILNLFWGVLIWKRKAEEALIASGLPYTIVRPGGMERPTDSYKETHNIVLANEDTYFGGQVSNLQVAELMAFMAKHRRLSFCKVVEVIAETTAPLTPMEELLAKIPSQRELPAEPKPDPVPVRVESKPTTSVVEKEIDQMEVLKTKPLSPYAMYDDLKPPTSPTPTPSTTPGSSKEKIAEPVQVKSEPNVIEMEPAEAPAQKARHLSPYMVYEDLKPPTSPTPTPSSASNGLNDKPVIGSPSLESNKGNDAAGTTPIIVNEKEIPQILPQNSSHQSPYYVYDDLKPPTSPSPNAPSTGSSISTSSGDSNPTTSTNNILQTSTREESGADQQHSKQQTSRPLSPYTMYEDLKPPSSPLPSMPKY